MGERGEAAQYLGMLKALVEQIEYGLRGSELQNDVREGVLGAYGQDMPAILAGESSRAAALVEFAGQGMVQLPRASPQLAAAARALTVVEHGFAAACEIAVGFDSPAFDPEEAVRQSEAMHDAADELTKYVGQRRAEHDAM